MENQLANANLLDESVSNSESLKTQRLNRTAQTAVNPQPTMKKPMPKEVIEEEDDNDEQFNEQEGDNGKQQMDYSSIRRTPPTSANKDADEKKILGMKPMMFYTLAGVALIVGGLFVYNKFIKKGGKGKSLDVPSAGTGKLASETASAVSNVASSVPEIKI